MKRINFFLLAALIMVGMSCSNENDALTDDINSSGKGKVMLLTNGILQFKDQATFDEYVLEGKTIEGFTSLYDYFGKAMSEAESYYDRKGGYEEFKTKYSYLYFPECNNDYSAYLPITNEKISKYVNKDCKVMIGNELKNYKDVENYQQLKDMGLAIPNKDENVSALKSMVIGWGSGTWVFQNQYELWIYSYWENDTTSPIIRNGWLCDFVEVCFRKKGFLGFWYNFQTTTNLVFTDGYVNFNQTQSGYSSHDYYVPYDQDHSPRIRHFNNQYGYVTFEGYSVAVYIQGW